MNIFKVLASTPRSKFEENQMSATLAYLLNPYMDHGLGYELLIKFLYRINADNEIIDRLKMRITDKNNNAKIKVFLEYEVEVAIIDIVIIIDDYYYISIENKIYPGSASDKEQLKIQYESLKREIEKIPNSKIMIVFLVPPEKSKLIEDEYKSLVTKSPDKNVKISWADINSDIQDILAMEQNNEISPLNEYLRHTLKALSVFIKDSFKGYNPDKLKNYVMNSKAMKERKSYKKICSDTDITYIGVPRGFSGLEKMETGELKNKEFQCTVDKIPPNHFWIERNIFIEYIKMKTEIEQ